MPPEREAECLPARPMRLAAPVCGALSQDLKAQTG